MAKKTGITIVSLLLFFTSCDFIEESNEKEVVARVDNIYLYKEDISGLLTDNTSGEDSALIVSNYIRRWATQQLLIERAKVNIDLEKQKEFDKLVENYKNELYAKAYTDAIIMRQLDTTIPFGAAKAYFDENGKNFRLNEDLVKLRYINLTKDNTDLEEIKESFQRFEEEDKQTLLEMAIQFKSYSLNDSVWVRITEVYDKIPLLNLENNTGWLKKEDFIQLEDSLEVYLISVKEARLRNEQAPLSYILPTIEQILLNNRKLELIKELEKDITKDAIKNEQFEIYN